MELNKNIFREYDIRGTVGVDLSPEFARLLGRAFATLVREKIGEKPVAIGHDCRESSPVYSQALAEGIASEGIPVELTGMGPTPQLYYALFSGDLGGGIQVTGSHNPSDMNGFKLCVGKKTLSGEEIQDLYQRMTKLKGTEPSGSAEIQEKPLREAFTKQIIENVKPHMGNRELKVVVDAGNGVGGLVGPEVLRELGCEVIELYCEPDGSFPNHHPDPTELKNIIDLQEKVRETGADLGIGWDGDADRLGVVDEKGEVIFGDLLLLIYGRALIQELPTATVIGDVKCSSRLFDGIAEAGGNPIMWKTGHSLIKKKLLETGAELAGEMSGHVFFNHRYFGFDDALYSSARLVEILSKTTAPISSLLDGIPPAVSTPEIRMDCPEELKFEIAKRAPEKFSNFTVDTTDGARIQFEKGWGLVRASNTQPVLVLRFEAENEVLLNEYKQTVLDGIQELKDDLS